MGILGSINDNISFQKRLELIAIKYNILGPYNYYVEGLVLNISIFPIGYGSCISIGENSPEDSDEHYYEIAIFNDKEGTFTSLYKTKDTDDIESFESLLLNLDRILNSSIIYQRFSFSNRKLLEEIKLKIEKYNHISLKMDTIDYSGYELIIDTKIGRYSIIYRDDIESNYCEIIFNSYSNIINRVYSSETALEITDKLLETLSKIIK